MLWNFGIIKNEKNKKRKRKKAQIMFSILLLIGIVVIIGGYIFLKASHEEKKGKTVISQTSGISTTTSSYRTTFFSNDLEICINNLVSEALSKSFKKKLEEKKITTLDNYPVVLYANQKVNINFDDIRDYIENYVKINFWKCENQVYDYTQTQGYYVLVNLVSFRIYSNKWKATINYKLYPVVNGEKIKSGTLEYEGRITKIKNLLKLYNGLINFEYNGRFITSNLFALIYGLYSYYYGYPTSNIIIPCREIVFDLNKARRDIKKVIQFLVPKYRVSLTDDVETQRIYLINYLDDYIPNSKVRFYPLMNNVKIRFSVVEGSSAYIRGDKLYVYPSSLTSPFGALSSEPPNECIYDLYYDMEIPVLVKLEYEGKVYNFVMDLVVNNNFATNKTWEETIADNSYNTHPRISEHEACPFDFSNGRDVKVVDINNNPIKGAYVSYESLKYDCHAKTDERGLTKIPINCINCKVFANKEGYIGSYEIFKGQPLIILKMFKSKKVNFWTIYTPQWILESWGNYSYDTAHHSLEFQGKEIEMTETFTTSNPEEINKIFNLRLQAQQNLVSSYKEVSLSLKLDSPQYYMEKERKIIPYVANAFVAEGVSYNVSQVGVNESGDFVETPLPGLYVFNKDNYYFDDKSLIFKPCNIKIYRFKGRLDGSVVYLIKVNGINKVIEFPYYNKVMSPSSFRGMTNFKYLVVCLPTGASLGSVLKYKLEGTTWIKQSETTFGNLFEEVRE